MMNQFGVAVRNEQIVILLPPTGPITKEDALLLAAYLVVLADESADEWNFKEILQAVKNT
jgi:hypothetical protein